MRPSASSTLTCSRAVDHVVVGQDVAVGADDDARAEARPRRCGCRSCGPRPKPPKERGSSLVAEGQRRRPGPCAPSGWSRWTARPWPRGRRSRCSPAPGPRPTVEWTASKPPASTSPPTTDPTASPPATSPAAVKAPPILRIGLLLPPRAPGPLAGTPERRFLKTSYGSQDYRSLAVGLQIRNGGPEAKLEPDAAQPQRVRDDGDRAEAHRRGRDHRARAGRRARGRGRRPRSGSRARCRRRPRRGSAGCCAIVARERRRARTMPRRSPFTSVMPGALDRDVGAGAHRDADVRPRRAPARR